MIEFFDDTNEISFILKPRLTKIENVVLNVCEKDKELDILKKKKKKKKKKKNKKNKKKKKKVIKKQKF